MNKQELMQSIATAFEIEATTRQVADTLGLTVPTVAAWPNDGELTRGVLRGICGDFVRKGKRVPADIVAAFKAAK